MKGYAQQNPEDATATQNPSQGAMEFIHGPPLSRQSFGMTINSDSLPGDIRTTGTR